MLNEATCSVCIIFCNPHSKPVRQTHDLYRWGIWAHPGRCQVQGYTGASCRSRECGSGGGFSGAHTDPLHAASFFSFFPLMTALSCPGHCCYCRFPWGMGTWVHEAPPGHLSPECEATMPQTPPPPTPVVLPGVSQALPTFADPPCAPSSLRVRENHPGGLLPPLVSKLTRAVKIILALSKWTTFIQMFCFVLF